MGIRGLIVAGPCCGHIGDKALIDPIPDEAALKLPVAFDGIPVVLEIADAIAHGVGVLALDERSILGLTHVLEHAIDGRIHGAVNIRISSEFGTFVMNGS